MNSFRPQQYPAFSERWLTVMLAETFRAFSSAVVWLVTLPFAALALGCVMAWDAVHGSRAARPGSGL